jgi:ribosome biogenesis GTPase A
MKLKHLKRELNNLISKSDIIIEVLDARDPFSYRSKELEHNVKNNHN